MDCSTSVSPQEVRKHLRKFLSVVSSGSASSKPKGQPKESGWTEMSVKDLTESPIFVLIHVPVARNSALDYFRLLVLENAHCFLYQLENPSLIVDIGEIDEAAAEISQTISALVRNKPDTWLSIIFQWALDSLAEISRRNHNRRALSNCALSEALRIYTSNKSTKSVLDLLNYCIGELLRISPGKCAHALVELSAKYGNVCDWILTHIGTAYPKAIINQLLNCGLEDFNVYIKEMTSRQNSLTSVQITQRQEQYSRDKLASLAAILGHLARQQSSELRCCFSHLIEEALKNDAVTKNQYSIPLLVKLSTFSRDVAEILVKDVGHFITLSNLFIVSNIFSQIPPQFLFTDQNIVNSLINIILSLGESSTSTFLFEKLLDLTYGVLNDNGDYNFGKWKTNVRKGCQKILDVLLFNMEKIVHNQAAFSSEQLLTLQELDKKLSDVVRRLFSENENESRYYFQLLILFCIIKGTEKTAHILSIILFYAENSQQLSSFLCVCRIISPFQTNVADELTAKLKFYYQELSTLNNNERTDSTKKSVDDDERRWLQNLKQIILWENEIIRLGEINFINLIESILNNYASFLEDLLPLAYGPAGDVVISIFLSIGQPVHLPPGQVIKLVSLLIRLFYYTLEKFGIGEELKFHTSVCDYILHFVNSQDNLTLEALMKTLFNVAFVDDRWKKLFCSKFQDPNETDLSSADSATLLVKNRSLSSKHAAATLVHSGVIGKGLRKTISDETIDEIDLLRKLAFVRFFDRLCLSKSSQPGGICYNIDTCRQMALRLNEYFCPDAISTEFSWDDWEFSKNYVQRFLTVFKRMNEIPFAWDLLSVVAEVYPCLWFCYPVMKAILGSVMAQLESAVDKNEKPPLKLLNVLDKWFFIAKKGKFLFEPLIFVVDVIPNISSYEAFVVLAQIWTYYQEIAPDWKSLEKHYEYFQCDDKIALIKDDANKYLEPVRRVMQANIANVGYVFSKIFTVS